MGCSNCKRFMRDKETEMSNTDRTENINNIDEMIDTEYLNSKQVRDENIFNFFIDLRSNPNKYIEESKQYELNDILSSAYNNKLYLNKIMLIQNPFFTLFLDTYIKKYSDNKENILFDLENNMQLKDYEKSLFYVKSNSNNPKDIVWNLLKENKNIALDEILYKNYDIFIVSSDSYADGVIAYFLFLKKN